MRKTVLAIPFLAVREERTSQQLTVIITFDLETKTNKKIDKKTYKIHRNKSKTSTKGERRKKDEKQKQNKDITRTEWYLYHDIIITDFSNSLQIML